MRAFHAPATQLHDPRFFLLRGEVAANEDRPGRVDHLLRGLELASIAPEEAAPATTADTQGVHTARYLDFLGRAHEEWEALPTHGPEVVANVQPRVAHARYPDGLVGRAGWHLGDLACPIGPHTFAAALAAAGCALAAAQALARGDGAAYALCRPPGHHAGPEVAGGHCFLNNAAIAAGALASAGARVAVIDIDVHHGNGTEAIFYERGDVLTVSVHTDPSAFYPFFTGTPDARGAGAGEGANRNIALPKGSGDAAWLGAIDEAIAAAADHGADTFVVSAGFDVHAQDPLSGMTVSTQAIAEAGRRLGAAGRPAAIVQEGGYMSQVLSDNLAAFLTGWEGR